MSPLVAALALVAFLVLAAWLLQWVDRKLTARLQARVGPPLAQPVADFVKLLAKEDVVPAGVTTRWHAAIPLVAFAAIATAFALLPLAGASPFGFAGDAVVALYLLALPTSLLFLLGWTSRNVFARVGAERALGQDFAYEVGFFLAALGPALAVRSWSLGDVAGSGAWFVLAQPVGFVVALAALQAKLERPPFDVPHADTEIVGGPLTDLSGRGLAIWSLARDAALVAGCALLAVLFLGGGALPGVAIAPWAAPFVVLAKAALLALVLVVASAAVGRYRFDQLPRWGWRILTPLALGQVAFTLLVGGFP